MDADARRKQLSAALNRVAGGDRAALRLVYDMTAAKLFGVCLRILNDRSEAEDVLQEVYITVWRRAGAFDEARASPITWLVAIARNRAIDRLRASGASQAERAGRGGGRRCRSCYRSPPIVLEAEQESGRLGGCLDELETRQSAAIRSAFMDGLTYEELAKRMGVPLGTMKSWIRRGLAKLKECLER